MVRRSRVGPFVMGRTGGDGTAHETGNAAGIREGGPPGVLQMPQKVIEGDPCVLQDRLGCLGSFPPSRRICCR